ncbi:MAG: AraC family transcriptional regulator [Pseudomonadota bacterium]
MPAAKALMFTPPKSLASVLFGGIYRDIRGAHLQGQDLLNHFPASPLVTVTRVLSGTLTILPDGPQRNANGNVIMVIGPQNTPVTSRSSGDLAAITLAIYPDAWRALGGDKNFGTCPNLIADALMQFDADKAITTGWDTLCAALPQTAESAIAPTIRDWARAMLTRAALAGPGRSLRSIERRLKRTSGQTRSTLDFFANVEGLHQTVTQLPDASAAEIAQVAGYADQSHMGRAVRRATGFTPVQLNKAIDSQEAFWCYRLLGERF